MANKLKVTLKRSPIGRPEKQRKILKSLGLTKLSQTKLFNDTPQVRGKLFKLNHLLHVEECS